MPSINLAQFVVSRQSCREKLCDHPPTQSSTHPTSSPDVPIPQIMLRNNQLFVNTLTVLNEKPLNYASPLHRYWSLSPDFSGNPQATVPVGKAASSNCHTNQAT